MYTLSRVVAESLRFLPRKTLSRAIGQLADVHAPSFVLSGAMQAYCRAYKVDLSDYEVPLGGFANFDEFFTRHLKAGARPLDSDENVILSPADGRIEAIGPIDLGGTLRVKGKLYEVRELLGDDALAREFDGGSFCIVYLSPQDYHRVHAPVSGPVKKIWHVPGTLFPVNAIGLEHVSKLFARNERVALQQDTQRFGKVVTVMVGAIGVGRISVNFFDLMTNTGQTDGLVQEFSHDAPLLQRGGELGVFHLGSTVILFFPKTPAVKFLLAEGGRVRMGQALAKGAA